MCPNTKTVVPFPLVQDFQLLRPHDLSPDQTQAIDRLPRDTGINIMRDRELDFIVVTRGGNPVAGLWTSWYADRFTFDVVVDSRARGNGLAKHLVHHAIHRYNSGRTSYRDPMMVIKVVNPAMRCLLEEHFGFFVALENDSHRCEMIPSTDDAGAVLTPEPARTFPA